MHITYKEEPHSVNIILSDVFKMQSLDSGLSSDFVWGTALWPSAFWQLSELKIMISHIMINDWLAWGYSNMKLVYMCHGGFKIGGLRSGPLLKIGGGGFQNWLTREK